MSKSRRFRSVHRDLLAGITLLVIVFIGWAATAQMPIKKDIASVKHLSKDIEIATRIAKEIITACPVVADVKDTDAFNSCAETLSQLEVLRDTMISPFMWGQQKAASNYKIKDSNTTIFDPYVWRRLYLATFMFAGEPKVEQVEDVTVIHLPTKFRNQFDMGAYPYPFWHSSKKWESYQRTIELLMFMEDGKLIGALRSAVNDSERPMLERVWDGKWHWRDGNAQEQPFVALYSHLFSKSNPHIAEVDAAYRRFEVKMREHTCLVCHNPDNSNQQNPLLILSYPNQALTLRHETVRQIQNQLMPPPDGIADDKEREKLVALAKAFAEAGDRALSYEGESSLTDASR